MPLKTEQARRKALTREMAEKQRAAAEAAMPISRSDLAALFEHLDAALQAGCDHSLKFTSQFLQSRNLPADTVIPWFAEHGGYCDCEVLGNVEEVLEP